MPALAMDYGAYSLSMFSVGLCSDTANVRNTMVFKWSKSVACLIFLAFWRIAALENGHHEPHSLVARGKRQMASGPPGPRTDTVQRPKVGNVGYGVKINSCTRKGVVALTFDDGPMVNSTERLLDLLDEHNVHATFFVAGSNKDKGHIDDNSTGYPGMLRRMHTAGHQIGSHTWSHRDLNNLTGDEVKEEMMYNEMALRNIFGWFPSYMRAPRLRCAKDCMLIMKDWGYHVIHTNLNTKDWTVQKLSGLGTSTTLVEKGLSADPTSHSYIIEAHDTLGEITYELAAFTIEMAKRRGYTLVTVGECLGDPVENWYRNA